VQIVNYFYKGIWKKAQEIKKYIDYPHLLSPGGYDLLEKKLMDEKRKTREHEAEFTENSSKTVDPPSPILRNVKWKMAHTKRYGQMTYAATQQISDKIVSSCVVCSQSKSNYCFITMNIEM